MGGIVKLRKYVAGDCKEISVLFFNTVHRVNAKDYTKSQLDAWASGTVDLVAWENAFLEHDTVIAEERGTIIGFGDIDHSGYLDRLYVHEEYQGQGVATAILWELEGNARENGIAKFCTHASITAKPFFEKQGYHVISENTVVRGTISLIHFMMEKG